MIPVLVPLLVALGKKYIKNVPSWALPLIAIGLGGAIDAINVYVIGGGYGGVWGPVAGAAGVGAREVLDQLRKAVKPDDAPKPDA